MKKWNLIFRIFAAEYLGLKPDVKKPESTTQSRDDELVSYDQLSIPTCPPAPLIHTSIVPVVSDMSSRCELSDVHKRFRPTYFKFDCVPGGTPPRFERLLSNTFDQGCTLWRRLRSSNG